MGFAVPLNFRDTLSLARTVEEEEDEVSRTGAKLLDFRLEVVSAVTF
jgi:hypothetical protein